MQYLRKEKYNFDVKNAISLILETVWQNLTLILPLNFTYQLNMKGLIRNKMMEKRNTNVRIVVIPLPKKVT